MSDNARDRDIERVRRHVDELIEHFDSVQIFATRCETGDLDGTVAINLGAGNWYARYGHVSEWVIKQDENFRANERSEDTP